MYSSGSMEVCLCSVRPVDGVPRGDLPDHGDLLVRPDSVLPRLGDLGQGQDQAQVLLVQGMDSFTTRFAGHIELSPFLIVINTARLHLAINHFRIIGRSFRDSHIFHNLVASIFPGQELIWVEADFGVGDQLPLCQDNFHLLDPFTVILMLLEYFLHTMLLFRDAVNQDEISPRVFPPGVSNL